MPAYFFDTSALVKRYVNETGSPWVEDLIDLAAGNDIYILRMTEVEVTSAVTRRRRGGTLSVTAAAMVLAQFRQDLANEYHVDHMSRPDPYLGYLSWLRKKPSISLT